MARRERLSPADGNGMLHPRLFYHNSLQRAIRWHPSGYDTAYDGIILPLERLHKVCAH